MYSSKKQTRQFLVYALIDKKPSILERRKGRLIRFIIGIGGQKMHIQNTIFTRRIPKIPRYTHWRKRSELSKKSNVILRLGFIFSSMRVIRLLIPKAIWIVLTICHLN